MGVVARMKSLLGGRVKQTTVATGTNIEIPDDAGLVYLTGTTTIAKILVPDYARNRVLILTKSDGAGNVTITNTNNPTAEGDIDLGGSNLTFGDTDVLTLLVRNDGTLVRVSNVDN